jgi:hypothetical protein
MFLERRQWFRNEGLKGSLLRKEEGIPEKVRLKAEWPVYDLRTVI